MSGRWWQGLRRSWARHWVMQLTTLTVLTGTFAVLVSLLTFFLNTYQVLNHWGNSVQMTVYLEEQVQAAGVSHVQAALVRMPELARVQYVSPDEALRSLSGQMKELTADLFNTGTGDVSNPLPASFRIDLRAQALRGGEAAVEQLVTRIASLAGVEDISYGKNWLKNYSAFVGSFARLGIGLAVLLILGSVLIIGNSLRAAIEERREEIEILELVGATPVMIRLPYIFEGATLAALAGVLAVVLSGGLVIFVRALFSEQVTALAAMVPMRALGWPWIVAVVASAALLGAVAAYLAVRRVNSGWSAAQRLEV